jgi:heme oxygenase
VPEVHSVRDALGVLYVLEGSALGGAVIGRMVERDLGLKSTYFARRGIAARWRAFADHLERHAPVSAQAAVATFEDMEVWLCR